MNLELSRRIATAFLAGVAQFDEREPLIRAAEQVDTFDQLPKTMRELLVALETRARLIER